METAGAPRTPVALVVMGVSGSGKSTLAQALADRLGWTFLEGDALHPPANVARMHAGLPLDDARRGPWLAAIVAWIDGRARDGHPAVVACSALRRVYRERLRQAAADVRFVYLQVPRAELQRRLRHRRHFMPATLLDSQLATLEEPAPDEPALVVDGTLPVPLAIARVTAWLRPAGAGPDGVPDLRVGAPPPPS